MAIKIKTYPRSLKSTVTAIADNGGFARLTIIHSANPIELAYKVGEYVNVFTDVLQGKFKVTEVSSPAYPVLYVTVATAFSSTGTGFLFSDTSIPIESNWSAVYKTPVFFEFERQDIEFDYVVTYAGRIRGQVQGDWENDYNLSAGSSVFLKIWDEETGEVLYSDLASINSGIYYSGSGYSIIDFNEDGVGSSSIAFMNSNEYYPDYYLKLTISCDRFEDDVTAEYYPDVSGVIYCDVQAFLESVMSLDDNYNHNDISFKDENLSGYFNISFQEYYTGGSNSGNTITENFFYCFAQRKLGQYGNMFEFLAKEANEKPLGKFLNMGVPEIRVSGGVIQHPFDFSILSTPGILKKTEVTYNTSKQSVSTTEYSLNDCSNSLNRIKLSGSYEESTIDWVTAILSISLLGIWHFHDSIPYTGIVYDHTMRADGQLVNANAFSMKTGSFLTFGENIVIDDLTVEFDSDSITDSDILVNNNVIDILVSGYMVNLTFNDIVGNSYTFPMTERYSDLDRAGFLIHGWCDKVDGTHETVWGFVKDITGFTTQQENFNQVRFGMQKNIDGSDEVWICNDIYGNALQSEGIDSYRYDYFILG